ncbi:MAG: hypothetical protein OQJ89_06875 [Kangiellaceae bacterium]|nr:hypothetical protein [Kangiellaceae bacterium]MCW9016667.1 hypothetical protein [Kangiellaceae bacterium]
MTKSIDLDEIKKRAAEISDTWQKKLGHLSDSVSRMGRDGFSHWLKSHNQIDELAEALEELLKASSDDDFQLIHVHTTLSSFVLPEEDLGQAEWYLTAHNCLLSFEKKLTEEKRFERKLLEAVIKELKFISQADEFHQCYQLQSIQQMVTTLYQSLQSEILEFKNLEKEKLAAQKEQEKLELARLETKKEEAAAKKAMMENVKIKEKRIAIIEEKKRKVAEKELLEAKQKQEMQQAEVNAKKAEQDRQAKLQDAYVDLQIEEKIGQWDLSDLIAKLRKRLESENLDETQKQDLTAFIDFARDKGA